jgi:hypothetical protein
MPKDEGVIRYLMREMDPSEEIEFERCMMEDENLLIEVESLRRTLEKTNQLPRLNPPQNLTEQLTRKASTYRQKQLLSSRFQQIPYIQYAAAAVIIVAFGITYSISLSDNPKSASPGDQNSEATQLRAEPSLSKPVMNAMPEINKATLAGTTEPWVDRNNVIRFAEESGNNLNTGMAYQQELESSYSKLTRVEDSILLQGSPIPSIQYTGTRN